MPDGALIPTSSRLATYEAAAIRGKVFEAIAAAYPALASECDRQRQARSSEGRA